MRQPCVIVTVGLCLAVGALHCDALDTIKTTTATVSGTITNMSPTVVRITKGNQPADIQVNTIEMIFFDKEPSQLKNARVNVAESQYDDALTSLEKIERGKVEREVVTQDIDFYTALCKARLALAGTGDTPEAEAAMKAFLNANPGNYHYLAAAELAGDLAMALGKYQEAEGLYTKLGRAPWADFRMRGAVATGYSRLAQGKPQEARQVFAFALKIAPANAPVRNVELAAKLGLARCDAAENKHAQAVAAVKDILSRADPEDVELQARAFNTLGTAYRRAGNPKDALWAFLHVDLIYFGNAESHAEALRNLEDLWKVAGKPEKAARARKLLDTRYKSSRWAQSKPAPKAPPKNP